MLELIKHSVIDDFSEDDIRNAKQYFGLSVSVGEFFKPIRIGIEGIPCNLLIDVLNELPAGEYIVDTRVHMLKPGWYPCIPGWHFDEVPRNEKGELDFDEVDPSVEHYVFILDSGTGSLTEFYHEKYTLYKLGLQQIESYGDLNSEIEKFGRKNKEPIANNTLFKFSILDAHRGMPATGSGWRYFFRATKNSKRKPINEIRTQTQVYIPEEKWEAGW